MSALLEVAGLTLRYGAVTALEGVDLAVAEGSAVALIGANGAGKTSLLRGLSGLAAPAAGAIRFDGRDLKGERPHRIARRGIVQVPEGRQLFGNLSVADNLRMGAYLLRDEAEIRRRRDEVLTLFPRLGERLGQPAGLLSGGEQQMLAIGRALMAKPRVLLLDEPTEGLAPIYVKLLFDLIVNLRQRGLTVMIVEQNVHHVLRTADRAYVLENGRIVMEGEGAALLNDDRLKTAYLGL